MKNNYLFNVLLAAKEEGKIDQIDQGKCCIKVIMGEGLDNKHATNWLKVFKKKFMDVKNSIEKMKKKHKSWLEMEVKDQGA